MTLAVEQRRLYHGFGVAGRPAHPEHGVYYLDLDNDTLSQWTGEAWETIGQASGAPGATAELAPRVGGSQVAPAPHTTVDPPGGVTASGGATPAVTGIAPVAAQGGVATAVPLDATLGEQAVQSAALAGIPNTTTLLSFLTLKYSAGGGGITLRVYINGLVDVFVLPPSVGAWVQDYYVYPQVSVGSTIAFTAELAAGLDAISIQWSLETFDVF
jgi:hypothetical protein